MEAQQYPRMYLYRRLVQAKLFIDAHYAEPIDLEAIADEAAFSKFHFIKQFKQVFQKTPHQYLIAVRIEKAMELLNDAIPVSEVCYSVGFESLGSFSTLFKRVTGLTPSTYIARRQALRTQQTLTPLNYIPGCFAARNGWLDTPTRLK